MVPKLKIQFYIEDDLYKFIDMLHSDNYPIDYSIEPDITLYFYNCTNQDILYLKKLYSCIQFKNFIICSIDYSQNRLIELADYLSTTIIKDVLHTIINLSFLVYNKVNKKV